MENRCPKDSPSSEICAVLRESVLQKKGAVRSSVDVDTVEMVPEAFQCS